MADQFGLSFVPDGQTDPTKKKVGEGGVTPTQQAIQLLSLRLPRVVGGSPIAPAPLLQSPGGAGRPSPESVAQQVMSRVLPTGATSPDASAPNVQQPAQSATPMQQPSGGYSDNPSPFSQSPISRDQGFAMPAQSAVSQPVPRMSPSVDVAPSTPNVPTAPNSMPTAPADRPIGQPGPGVFVPNTPPPGMFIPNQPTTGKTPEDFGYGQTPIQGNDVIGNQWPEGSNVPPGYSGPSETPASQPQSLNQMSPEMEALLDKIRSKYSNDGGNLFG
jgi:hypothetical protein